jgi:hypothetical protein
MPFDSSTRRVIPEIALDNPSEAGRGADVLGRRFGGLRGLRRQRRGGARRLGEGLRNPLELAGGIEHVAEDAAEAGLELVDKSAQLRLAVLGGGGGRVRLLGAKAEPSTKPFQKKKLDVTVLPSTALRIGLVREWALDEKPYKNKEIRTHLEYAPGRRPALHRPARRATGSPPSTPFRVFTAAPQGQKFDPDGAPMCGALHPNRRACPRP